MSKAFTSEETAPDPVVRPRAPLPVGVPNYVTRRGLEALQRELTELERERVTAEHGAPSAEEQARAAALATRVTELAGRIHGAVLVDPPAGPTNEVRFGARVVARDAEGRERRLQIVGVDEANGREGKVAFVAPIARALLGRRRGELATWRSPRGEEELEVVDIEYDERLDEHLG
jgi:transcription elongation factor GreB